jgi:hypothetical protein
VIGILKGFYSRKEDFRRNRERNFKGELFFIKTTLFFFCKEFCSSRTFLLKDKACFFIIV